MGIQEFSDRFDVLLNSYATKAGFGSQDGVEDIRLNEHEKSVFLTQAQEDTVLSLYTGKNSYGESFEQTEEIRRYLSNLVNEAELTPISNTQGNPIGMGTNSYFFTLPDGSGNKPAVWFITYEGVYITGGTCDHSEAIDVYPVKQDEYHKIKKNPFRGANNRRALRLDLADGVIEIVCKSTVSKYYLRYLTKPHPIVLVGLGDLEVGGESTAHGCDLHEALHQQILERAVQLALQSKGIRIKNSENN